MSPSKLPLSLLAGFRTRPELERRQTVGWDPAARLVVGADFLEDKLLISNSVVTFHLPRPWPQTQRWPYPAVE